MSTSGSTIELKNVSKDFKNSEVIKSMNLIINPSEFLVLLGPSGCGKSTTLRMIAGLDTPTNGEIAFDNKNIQDVSSGKRNIAMVFQDYALYPNMTVRQNIEYALKVHKVNKNEVKERVDGVLNTLDLSDQQKKHPAQLSGGQKQRVALGRGMVKKSKIFLLDEPLSNIDVQLREKARDEIIRLHNESKQTIVYVTHDQMEAMALGDRIAVINDGKIQMIDTPKNIYENPVNLFVAKFIGTPKINLFDVNYDGNKLYLGKNNISSVVSESTLKSLSSDTKYTLGIRSENVRVNEQDAIIQAKVEYVVDYGKYYELTLSDGNNTFKANVNAWDDSNEQVNISFNNQKTMLFNQDNGKRI